MFQLHNMFGGGDFREGVYIPSTQKVLAKLLVVNFISISVNKLGLCPANIYLFKVNNRNIKKRCEIYSKLTIKTPEQCHSVSIVDFEQVHISWVRSLLFPEFTISGI